MVATTGEPIDGDVAIVLSSLVAYRRETAFAKAMRACGVAVGFIGLASQKLPHLFEDAADFIVNGEPEAALLRSPNRIGVEDWENWVQERGLRLLEARDERYRELLAAARDAQARWQAWADAVPAAALDEAARRPTPSSIPRTIRFCNLQFPAASASGRRPSAGT